MCDYFALSEKILEENHFSAAKGLQTVSAGLDKVCLQVQLTPECTNGYGIAHGGFLYTVADCTAGVTAFMDGRQYVTMDSHFQFISNLRGGVIRAEGTVLHRGRTMATILVNLMTETGRMLAHGTFNMYAVNLKDA